MEVLLEDETIKIHDQAKVSDLAKALVEEVELWIDDPRYVTIYDTKEYHVCWNHDALLKDEYSGGPACLAYIVPGKFYFVEGGWGHHMIQMDCVHLIPDPMSITELVDLLQETIVYWGPITKWRIFDLNQYMLPGETLDLDGNQKLGDLEDLKCLHLTTYEHY